MLVAHAGHRPAIDRAAMVAVDAVVCGNVTIGAGTRVLSGARIVAEGGEIAIGRECIVMENAALRSTARHSLRIGNNCLFGPQAHVVGCTIDDEVFVATGAAIFHGARVGRGAEVRVHAVVHIQTELAAGETVPIGWVAVGTPARMFAASEHERIWALQEPLDFPITVYGIDRAQADMVKITRTLSEALASHATDEVLP